MAHRLAQVAYLGTLLLPATLAVDLVDCYYYDGRIAANNTICPNSRTCCNADATCTDERLCHNNGDSSNLFVRGPCADNGWNKTECGAVCLYDEIDGIFPRVHQCSDQSWCCDNDANCCENGHGVFLNATGDVVDSLPTTSSSSSMATTSSSSSTTSSAPPTTTPDSAQATQIASSTATPEPDPGLSTPAKAGLGVGIALGVLLIAAIGVIFWLLRKRRANNAVVASPEQSPFNGGEAAEKHGEPHYAQSPSAYTHVPQQESQDEYKSATPREAPGSIPGEGHLGVHEVEATAPSLQELEGSGVGKR